MALANATGGAARVTVLRVTQTERSHGIVAWQALVDGYAPKSSNDPAKALQLFLATPKKCKDAKELKQRLTAWSLKVAKYEAGKLIQRITKGTLRATDAWIDGRHAEDDNFVERGWDTSTRHMTLESRFSGSRMGRSERPRRGLTVVTVKTTSTSNWTTSLRWPRPM